MYQFKGTKYLDLITNILESWGIKIVENIPNVLVGILVFFIVLKISRALSFFVVKLFQKLFPKSRKQETILTLVQIFRFLIILFGTFIPLEIMGLSGILMKLLGSLGVAGIIAGVALKDLVSSIFSGMLVGIDKSFKVGDTITINNITGTVEEIGFLTTKVINEEGKKVYIPNQLIFSAPFINSTSNQNRKIIIDFEIPNSEDLEKTKKTLFEAVQLLSFVNNPENSQVVFTRQKLGIFSIQIKFWIKENENISTARSEAILSLKKALESEGINISQQNS